MPVDNPKYPKEWLPNKGASSYAHVAIPSLK